jgi:hypothetical protein
MFTRRDWLLLGCAVLISLLAARGAAAREEPLMAVGKGQTFNETGQDTATHYTTVDCPELGGKAVKVVYASGDSAGMKAPRLKNWKPFTSLQFNALSPAKEKVLLVLSVRHKRTTGLATRADVPITLQPGKNTVKIGIDEIVNTNGSTPDLSDVREWYIACEDGKTPTVYFGDFVLTGDDQPAGGGPAGPAPAYHITGTIGPGGAVDLTATPVAPPPPKPLVLHGDPARLARLRATKMPPITRPVMFYTPEADAICSALEVYPPDNAWNLVVSDWPVHPSSKNMLASIGLEKPLRYNADMGFILIPPDQKKTNLARLAYPDESDKGPYPIPAETPIEDWPVNFQEPGRKLTLDQVQRDVLGTNSDRHAIIVDPVHRVLYEFYQMKKTAAGWEASQASIFDLKTNQLRPDGWTSSDAAGLPLYPATIRYDELERGEIEHAMRISVRNSRRAYVPPATHYASTLTDENLPRMGERFRLRGDFDVSGFSPPVKTILNALKKYGAFVADNGLEWCLSVTPDPRIAPMHAELRKVKVADFEAVTREP